MQLESVSNPMSFTRTLLVFYAFTAMASGLVLDAYHPVVILGIAAIAFASSFVLMHIKTVGTFPFVFLAYHFMIVPLFSGVRDPVYFLAYALLLICFFIVSKEYSYWVVEPLGYAAAVLTVVQFIRILAAPIVEVRYKMLLGINITMLTFQGVEFARSSIIAVLSFFLVNSKSPVTVIGKFSKYVIIVVSAMIVIISGKLGTIGAIILTLLIGWIFKNIIRSRKSRECWVFLFLLGLFGFIWAMPFIQSLFTKLGTNSDVLFAGRQRIWPQYIAYFRDLPLWRMLFGGFYPRQLNDIGGSIILHPHNQYMTILLSTGFVGSMLYFIMIYRSLIVSLDIDIRLFMVLLAILIMGLSDDYFFISVGAITVWPFLLFAFSRKNVGAAKEDVRSAITLFLVGKKRLGKPSTNKE